jgi:hypothetical protein
VLDEVGMIMTRELSRMSRKEDRQVVDTTRGMCCCCCGTLLTPSYSSMRCQRYSRTNSAESRIALPTAHLAEFKSRSSESNRPPTHPTASETRSSTRPFPPTSAYPNRTSSSDASRLVRREATAGSGPRERRMMGEGEDGVE